MPEQKIEVHYSYEQEIAKVNEYFEKQVSDFLSGYTQAEILTFETKRVEAEKFIADGESVYITTLATAKGIEAEVLAIKILENAQAYLTAYCQLEAWKDKEEARLKAKFNIQ